MSRLSLRCNSRRSRIKQREGGPALPFVFLTSVIIFEKPVEGSSPLGLARFAREAQKLTGVPGEVDILVAGNRRIQALNLKFRKKDRPTDVLSFPHDLGGDIAISADVARQNARRFDHEIASELKILILHGMLHLAGYDHERDGGRMQRIENKLRAQLKLPGALIQRTRESGRAKAKSTSKPARGRRTR